jgi:hypothetical protein
MNWKLNIWIDDYHHRRQLILTRENPYTWYGLRLPRFARDNEGWWLAPLIRIEIGSYSNSDMIEIPFIEHDLDGLRFHAIYRA